MWYYLKKEWKWNTLAIGFKILDSAMVVAANVVMISMFQCVIDGTLEGMIWTIIAYGAIVLADAVLCFGDEWASGHAKMAMNNRYRDDAVATLLSTSYGEFHGRDSGEYLSWLTNDVNQINTTTWDTVYGMVAMIFKVLFSAVVLASMHWSLLAASILIAIVVISVPKVAQGRISNLSERCAQEQAEATAKLKDLLSGMDVLVSFGKKDRFREKNQEASNLLEKPKLRLNLGSRLFSEGIGLVSTLCTLLSLVLVAFLAIKGLVLTGTMAGGANMISMVSGGLSSLGQYCLSIQAGKPYFSKIRVHGEQKAARQISEKAAVEEITMEGISFSYGEKKVLHNLSLDFQKGGKYALTGPSGCGKSTILKLLLGWLPDYQGSIRMDQKDARQIPEEERLNQMSYIEQDVFLFNSTIRDNIALDDDLSQERWAQIIRDSALDGDLKVMPQGLDTPVGENGSALSGGQKQRVAIARALAHNRSILLVDEGTSALDAKNANIVEESLLANPDLTLILVSHHLTPERKRQFTKVYELTPAEENVHV